MNIICIAQWLFDANFEFLHFPVRLHEVINNVNQNDLSCKHVSIVLSLKYDVISQLHINYVSATLRTLYA